MAMGLVPYRKTHQDEILAFISAHDKPFPWTKPLLLRFLNDLTSSPDLIFDLHHEGKRVAVAVLIDKVQNPANAANFELLAVEKSLGPEEALDFFLPLAKQRLPASRSGVMAGFSDTFSAGSKLMERHGFEKYFEMYEMRHEDPRAHGQSHEDEFSIARESDGEAEYRCLTEAFRFNPDTNIPRFEDWLNGRKRNLHTTWIKRQEDEVIAFLNLYPSGEAIEIGTVGVLPSHRGKGYARRLLAHALNWCAQHGSRKVKLSVAVQNERALGLYTSLGFKADSRSLTYRWNRNGS